MMLLCMYAARYYFACSCVCVLVDRKMNICLIHFHDTQEAKVAKSPYDVNNYILISSYYKPQDVGSNRKKGRKTEDTFYFKEEDELYKKVTFCLCAVFIGQRM